MSTNLTLHTQLRTAVYNHFVATGKAPTKDKLAEKLGIPQQEIELTLHVMAEKHLIVLQGDDAEILMAIPFSAVPTPFAVESHGVNYWANCMWDALGIPAALGQDSRISTNCSDCGDAVVLSVENGRLEGDQGVVHFLLPPRQWWDDIVFT